MPRIALALDGGCNLRAHFRAEASRRSSKSNSAPPASAEVSRLCGLRGVLLGNAQRSIIGVGPPSDRRLAAEEGKLVARRRAIHFPTVMARLRKQRRPKRLCRSRHAAVDGRIYFGCERIDKLMR